MAATAFTTGDDAVIGSLEAVLVSGAQGHVFTMEQGRLNTLEGKMGAREALSHRIISEAGSGQSRAMLPAGLGGVPTIPLKGTTAAG